jgi:mono/diheme cytochrome c family protein
MKARSAAVPLTLLLLLLSGSLRAAVQAPALADAPVAMKQGITLTLKAGNRTDTRGARLVALSVPAGEPVSPFLPASPFNARWEADITSDLKSEYTFAADVDGSLKVTLNGVVILEGNSRKTIEGVASNTYPGGKLEGTLAIDGVIRLTGKPVQLNKGANQLVVEYQSPGLSDAVLRLLWSSREFPWEPVPPTVFLHDANAKDLRLGERIREGRLLFAQFRCSACHEAAALLPEKGKGMPELAQDAPIFDELGAKYREPWLAAWINDPHAIRPHALMPKMFASEPGKPVKIDQRAADLAAYFASVGVPNEGQPIDESQYIGKGGALFANLGCIACHTKPDADGKDEFDRIPLTHVKAKWQPPALEAFLKDPAKNFAWNRMPHFRLSDEEAEKLAAYLLSTANRDFPAGPAGDPTRGAQLLATSGCLNCHAGLPPAAAPTLALTLDAGWSKGCLAPDGAARAGAPDFAFTPAQRDALLAFAADGFASLKLDPPNEFAERQIQNLRCAACHARDGRPSVWSQLDDETAPLQAAAPLEEGEGKPIATTALPMLTWLGEKLQPAWMANFIAGRVAYKPRPWIVARMPGFNAPAESLAKGLSLQHGFPLESAPEAPADPAMIKAGETLISENGGFNCIQCHDLAKRPATAAFEAPAPNLAYAHERLRKEYYHRWTLFPLRIDPETKMPRFADDEGKTPLTDFFDGKATEQFEAIWQYLQTYKK